MLDARLPCAVVKHIALVVLCLITSACRSVDQKKTAYLASGNDYFSRAMYEKALDMYVKAITTDRMYGEAYYRAGVTAIKLHRWAEAGSHLQRAIELKPQIEDAYSQLADLYLFAYGAAEHLRKPLMEDLRWLSVRLGAEFPGTYQDARISAYIALFTNDKTSALQNFEKANALKPYQHELVVAYMQALISTGRLDVAEKLGIDTLAANPSALQVYNELLWQYIRADRTADIERILRSKVANHPKLIDGYLELAAHYFLTKRPVELVNTLNQIAANTADFPSGALAAGDFCLRVRDFPSAMQQYQRGIDQGFKSRHLYQKRMAEVLAKQNRTSEAQRLIGQVLKENPSDAEAIAIRASLRVIAEDKAQFPSAINDLRAVMVKMPSDFVLRYTLGRALLLTGDIRGAILEFQEALKLRPDYIWPRLALAHILIELREYGKALMISQGVLDDEGINVPFDTAGQRPGERPSYDHMLAIKPNSAAVLSSLAAKLLEASSTTNVKEARSLAQSIRQKAAAR